MNGLTKGTGTVFYTVPSLSWRIPGMTEFHDKLYGTGVTTTRQERGRAAQKRKTTAWP
jgi:hypothetical protein